LRFSELGLKPTGDEGIAMGEPAFISGYDDLKARHWVNM